jgi:glucokinase
LCEVEHSTSGAAYFLGLDIGGTKTEALVVDQQLAACGWAKERTNTAAPDALVVNIVTTASKAIAAAGVSPDDIAAVGVGIPGQVLPASGVVRLAVNLGLKEYPLQDALEAAFHVPTILENDIRLAAFGAFERLHRETSKTKRADSLAYIGIGTGIAAGVVLNGKLYRGARGMAGEIGHMVVEADGALCNCGQRGCLETIVSGPGILRQAARLLPGANVRHAGDVYRLAEEGQSEAKEIVSHISRHLAQAILWLLLTYDVTHVVIGGGLTRAKTAFLEPILGELHRQRMQSPLIAELLGSTQISQLPPEDNAGLWGAIRLAQQQAEQGQGVEGRLGD